MIRKHKPQDLDQIINVWHSSSSLAHPFLNLDFVEKLESEMREIYIPDSNTWVYEEKNCIKGFISMIDEQIAGLFVLPEYHSNGVGTSLVNYVNEYHKQLKVEVFERNTIGRAFYKKYGFSLVSSFIHDESGEKVLRLIK